MKINVIQKLRDGKITTKMEKKKCGKMTKMEKKKCGENYKNGEKMGKNY